jgi:hypothetical protein
VFGNAMGRAWAIFGRLHREVSEIRRRSPSMTGCLRTTGSISSSRWRSASPFSPILAPKVKTPTSSPAR